MCNHPSSCLINDLFSQIEKFDCFCSLLSSSSPLLLGQFFLQYAYKDSIYFSLASLTLPLVFSIHVSFSWYQSGTKCLFDILLPYSSIYFSTFHTFTPSIWTAWYTAHPAILLLTSLYYNQTIFKGYRTYCIVLFRYVISCHIVKGAKRPPTLFTKPSSFTVFFVVQEYCSFMWVFYQY